MYKKRFRKYKVSFSLVLLLTLLKITISYGQKTIITGRVDCFDKKNDCCYNCPNIWINNDSISVVPDNDGYFSFETFKKENDDDFTLYLVTLGVYSIWITDIPYKANIDFDIIQLINVNKITPRKYKRVRRNYYRKSKSEVETNEYMRNNFAFILPIGGMGCYFDTRELPTNKILNPLNKDDMIEIEKSKDNIIILNYNDLVKDY